MNNSHLSSAPKQENRPAPRHQVNLGSPVIITAVSHTSEGDEESYFVLNGRLLDVSRTGLALIVSNYDAQELKKIENDLIFRLLLPLPAQAIELEATPARYERLEKEAGVLVGAAITNMNGRDRILFMDFIHQFEVFEP